MLQPQDHTQERNENVFSCGTRLLIQIRVSVSNVWRRRDLQPSILLLIPLMYNFELTNMQTRTHLGTNLHKFTLKHENSHSETVKYIHVYAR